MLRYTTAADVGVIGNKLAVDGQAYGGLSHSIGFALSEEYNAEKKRQHSRLRHPDDRYDPGRLQHHLSGDASQKRAPAPPAVPKNFQCSGHMAVINAIANACGVRIYELPATPDKVKAAYEKKQRARI